MDIMRYRWDRRELSVYAVILWGICVLVLWAVA